MLVLQNEEVLNEKFIHVEAEWKLISGPALPALHPSSACCLAFCCFSPGGGENSQKKLHCRIRRTVQSGVKESHSLEKTVHFEFLAQLCGHFHWPVDCSC